MVAADAEGHVVGPGRQRLAEGRAFTMASSIQHGMSPQSQGRSRAGDGAVPSVLGAILCSRCRRKTRYQSAPRNIYRHIILSEIKEATAALPLVRGPEGLQRVPGSLQLLPPSLCHGVCCCWPHGFTSFPSLSGGDLAAGDGLRPSTSLGLHHFLHQTRKVPPPPLHSLSPGPGCMWVLGADVHHLSSRAAWLLVLANTQGWSCCFPLVVTTWDNGCSKPLWPRRGCGCLTEVV